ncbi:MAG: protein-L-isoaspartate O-methyltransferase [Gammaproteobacteria bacterium]|nr:protein-L-isoaspartate O-methyltransferase [Gammaproteobacteria bacterium]
MDIEQARFNMIEQQIRPWDVLDFNVLKIIEKTPRELFVPSQHQKLAFSDLEIPLQNGQWMMAPKVEARMLQALQVQSGDEILEIGTGTGFITACLAKLGTHVDSIEFHAEFSNQAQSNLDKLEINNVNLLLGDALTTFNHDKKYAVIAVTASMPVYLDVFEKLLTDNGRMFVVVGKKPIMQAQLITKIDGQDLYQTKLFETNLEPLIGIKEPQNFQL